VAIVLLGATGYTGRLTARELTRAGHAPVLAGRNAQALQALVADLAPLAPIDAAPTWKVADASDPQSVRALVTSPTDVLVSTVGPFTSLGTPAVEAALDAGCVYIDSTGEGSFIHRIFGEWNNRAVSTGTRLLTAFGYDYVPGTLAAEIALSRSGDATPRSVEIGYFVRGPFRMSSGTKASVLAMLTEPQYVFRSGQMLRSFAPPHVLRFPAADPAKPDRQALGVTGSELFTIPPRHPGLVRVDVGVGWAGSRTPLVRAAGAVVTPIARKVQPLLNSRAAAKLPSPKPAPTGQGPSDTERAQARTLVIARVLDALDRPITEVRMEGPDPYGLTGALLAWAAGRAHKHRPERAGALGPVDAWGLDVLREGAASLGLVEVVRG